MVDSAKAIKRTCSPYGSYEILYKSGKNYVGKGSFDRAITSAVQHAKPNPLNNNMGDVVTSIRWRSADSCRQAFIEEYALMTQRGVRNSSTYNLRWSPGLKYYGK